MWKTEYKRELEAIGPNARQLDRMREILDDAPQRHKNHLGKKALAAMVVCAALLVSALAVAPTLWDIITRDLGGKAPYATEVLASCEDQGIRLEVHSALVDSKIAKLYFTLQDLTGDRLDDKTQLFFGPENRQEEGNTEMPWNSASVHQLSYDPETRTALFVLTIEGWSTKNKLPLQFAGDYILSGHRVSSDSVMVTEEGLTVDLLPSATASNGNVVLLPDPARTAVLEALAPEDRPAFPITAVGFASDKKLHVRAHVSLDGVTWSNIIAQVLASEEVGSGSYHGDYDNVTQTVVEDGIDYRFNSYGPDDLPRILMVEVNGDYSVHAAPVEGIWSVDIPFQTIPSIDMNILDNLRIPCWAEGETLRADHFSLSALSFTLYCSDMYTDHKWIKTPDYSSVSISVLLYDGTVLTPALSAKNTPWATWEFNEPIDLEQVVSVAIEGHTILVP